MNENEYLVGYNKGYKDALDTLDKNPLKNIVCKVCGVGSGANTGCICNKSKSTCEGVVTQTQLLVE